MIGPEERLAHIKECLPEICSLDCGTLNFSDTDMIYISTPPTLRKMAEMARDWGLNLSWKYLNSDIFALQKR